MSRRSMVSMAVVVVLAGSFGVGLAGASRAKVPCGFGPAEERVSHDIQYRSHVSCPEARRILRRLRGSRSLIPMACTRDRHIDGWRLRNVWLQLPDIETQFSRGDVLIDYHRSSGENPVCKQRDLAYDGYS